MKRRKIRKNKGTVEEVNQVGIVNKGDTSLLQAMAKSQTTVSLKGLRL